METKVILFLKLNATATGITTNTGEKRYVVDNAVGVSSISSNIISLKMI